MLIILRDCFIEARVDADNPDFIYLRARQLGDIERFAPKAKVTRSKSTDYAYSAMVHRPYFDERLKIAVDDMSSLALTESVNERDLRRRTLYRSLVQLMASEYGAFGMAGNLDGLDPGYPPDLGLPDDEDIAQFLKD